MAALLLRRAFPSTLVPLASRSARSSSCYYLFASRLLPFSTCHAGEIPEKSLEDCYHDTVEKLTKEVESSSSWRIPLPRGYPFDFTMCDNEAYLRKSHGTKEMVHIKINGNDPSISMDARIMRGGVDVLAKITPKPDQLRIDEVQGCDFFGNMGNYKDYLETRGLMPETISFLYGLLVFNKART